MGIYAPPGQNTTTDLGFFRVKGSPVEEMTNPNMTLPNIAQLRIIAPNMTNVYEYEKDTFV